MCFTLGAADQIGARLNPDSPAEQILVLAFGKDPKDVTALTPCNFFAQEFKIVIILRDNTRATILCQGGLPIQHEANNPFSD